MRREIKPIKLSDEISDPEFVAINHDARIAERAFLLGLLRVRLSVMHPDEMTATDVITAISDWADARGAICEQSIKETSE